jgi:CRP/FNR family cyclic AMP-dependent transcriptional regulator
MPSPAPTRRFVHLLDVEPELGTRLPDDDRIRAHAQLRLPVTSVPKGTWSLPAVTGPSRPFGLMIVDGILLHEVELAGRRALQILGPGDVVMPRRTVGELVGADLSLIAAVPTQVAVLDDRLQRAFAVWPPLAIALVERAGTQMARLAVQAAIAQLSRVEDRLEATFWDLADRWGRVTPEGIRIPLQLTHEALAQMVGGRRPTITLALRQLAERGIVTRQPDRSWVLRADAPTFGELRLTEMDDDARRRSARLRRRPPAPSTPRSR